MSPSLNLNIFPVHMCSCDLVKWPWFSYFFFRYFQIVIIIIIIIISFFKFCSIKSRLTVSDFVFFFSFENEYEYKSTFMHCSPTLMLSLNLVKSQLPNSMVSLTLSTTHCHCQFISYKRNYFRLKRGRFHHRFQRKKKRIEWTNSNRKKKKKNLIIIGRAY